MNVKLEEMMMNQKSQAEKQEVLIGNLIEVIKQMKIDDCSDSQIESSR
jgi:hypothetical protein